jgi:predicted nucleic acid-binding protein
MRLSQFVVVLDTCVLAPMPVMDTLLRLAGEPALYIPKWSTEILEELRRTMLKFECTPQQIERRINAMTTAFPDALVEGFEGLIPSMTNHPKDRHVLAVAVKCGAHAIVSDNRKHFSEEALAPYNLECITSDEFLKHQYHLDPDAFINVLREQAADMKSTLPHLISKHVPSLSKLITIREER